MRRALLAGALAIVVAGCGAPAPPAPPEPVGVTSAPLIGAAYELDAPVPDSPEAGGQTLLGFAADATRGLVVVDDAPDSANGVERYVAIPIGADAQALAPPRVIDPVSHIAPTSDGFVGIVPQNWDKRLTARFIDKNGLRVEDVPISDQWSGCPAFAPSCNVSVACDAAGSCMALWQQDVPGSSSTELRVAPLRRGAPYPASTVVASEYDVDGLALGGAAGLASVSYSRGIQDNGGVVSFQRFDEQGAPAGPPVVLATDSSGAGVSAVAVADGFVVGWHALASATQAEGYRLVHLDAAGAEQGPPLTLPAGVESGPGWVTLGPWPGGVLLYTEYAKTPYRVGLDGKVTQLATAVPGQDAPSSFVWAMTGVQLFPQGKPVVAWDGSGDVFAQALDPATGVVGKPDVLTRADNSQMVGTITRAQSSLVGFWYDNRADASGLYDVPLDASGCPTQAGKLRRPIDDPTIYLGGTVSDGRTTLVVDGVGTYGTTARRFAPDGTELPPLYNLPFTGTVLPFGATGGYWIVGPGSTNNVVHIAADGSQTQLSAPDAQGTLVANAQRDQVLALWLPEGGQFNCDPSLHAVLIDASGKDLFAPRVIDSVDCWGNTLAIPDGDGYVLLVARQSGTATVRRLDGDGVWQQPPVPAPPELASATGGARTADGFVWLAKTALGDIRVVRTDASFTVTGTDTIPGGDGAFGRLQPALDPRFVVVSRLRVWPARIRIELYRLDGKTCTTPPHVDGGAAGAGGAAGTGGAAGAGNNAGPDASSNASGCGCRSVPAHTPAPAALLVLAALVALGLRRRE